LRSVFAKIYEFAMDRMHANMSWSGLLRARSRPRRRRAAEKRDEIAPL
jgi:hypothetical protein